MEATNFTIDDAKPYRHFAASMAVVAALAAFIAVWNWSTEPPVFVPGRLSAPFSRVEPGIQDPVKSLIPGDLDRRWPEQVGNAARIFHCAPKTSQDTRHSVVVWTDTKNNVVAYGAALWGGVLPPYATGLVDANEPALRRLVYPAAQGFRVVAAEKTYALKIRDTSLACVPSSDD